VKILSGDESASERHARTEELEETRTNGGGVEPCRLGSRHAQVGAGALLHLRHTDKAVGLVAVVDEVGRGEMNELSLLAHRSDHHHFIGILEGQWFEQHTVHDAEHCRGGADGECQRGHGDDGEAGGSQQLPGGVANVLQQDIHADFFFEREDSRTEHREASCPHDVYLTHCT
jgi:hypothetical protein